MTGEMRDTPDGYANLDAASIDLAAVLRRLNEEDIVGRIWRKDHTVWKEKDEEISNRLGWLDAPKKAAASGLAGKAFAREVRAAGFTNALLLGMGGSSLAPDVFSRVFGPGAEGLPLSVLDSTDPAEVLRFARSLPLDKTLFLVSSKSGTTLETNSLLNYFFVRVAEIVGRAQAGSRFVAVTDPGSRLETEARRLDFRAVFPGDPDIGGRFSVFSAFGLVPAALLGMDVPRLLASAEKTMNRCRRERIEDNPGAFLGAALAALALAGRDKAVFLLSPSIGDFGGWLEQLIAESTGKDGRGILPLVRETGRPTDLWGEDRTLIVLALKGDEILAARASSLASRGAPVISLTGEDAYDLGGQFYLWEFATAVGGAVLGINPFDQPNVALAKKETDAALRRIQEIGRLPEETPSAREDVLTFLAGENAPDVEEGLAGDYIAIQAFLPPFPEVEDALKRLAARIEERSRRPVTFDFGPRFLHSTGQLHKGDAGRGLFLQLTADHADDAPVPGSPDGAPSSYTFGELIDAQALGDRQALRQKGRRLVRVHLEGDLVSGIAALTFRL
jgi:glucose-6-phosphate isomerase